MTNIHLTRMTKSSGWLERIRLSYICTGTHNRRNSSYVLDKNDQLTRLATVKLLEPHTVHVYVRKLILYIHLIRMANRIINLYLYVLDQFILN